MPPRRAAKAEQPAKVAKPATVAKGAKITKPATVDKGAKITKVAKPAKAAEPSKAAEPAKAANPTKAASTKRKADTPADEEPSTKKPKTEANSSELTLTELKALCKERGLPVSGRKAELQERLEKNEGKIDTSAESKSNAINTIPSKKLEIFVWGENENSELGLGAYRREGKMPTGVRRPRLNHNLDVNTVGVVQMDTGGQHCAAITFDNQILTWGANDNFALGRETAQEDKYVPLEGSDDAAAKNPAKVAEEDDSGLNDLESTPTPVDPKHFPAGTKFVSVSCSDSATFALTEDGLVYGWGGFSVSLSHNRRKLS
jgi:regulator of chromosome condensation